MAGGLMPYGVMNGALAQPADVVELEPGEYQVVHFTMEMDRLRYYLEAVDVWFEDRDDVILVASGVSLQGDTFMVMEWEGCEIDPLFLKILEHDRDVTDFCVYTRTEEAE